MSHQRHVMEKAATRIRRNAMHKNRSAAYTAGMMYAARMVDAMAESETWECSEDCFCWKYRTLTEEERIQELEAAERRQRKAAERPGETK